MTIYAVFDSIPSARIVDRIVGEPSLVLVHGEVRSSAILMACGALSGEQSPTLLILDSDSLEDRMLRVERMEIEGILDRSRGRAPYRLVLAVPQVEGILFSDRDGFERAFGKRVADDDWFEGRFRPRAVLKRLLTGRDYEEAVRSVLAALDDPALERMARHPVAAEVRSFIAEVQAPAKRIRLRRAG